MQNDMALNKQELKIKFIQIFNNHSTENNVEKVAKELADAIDEYVKEAKIIYTTGLTSPSGAVTGVFEGKLE